MVFIWKFLIAPLGGAFAIYELLPAFIVACGANMAVSLATAEPDTDTVRTFESI